jgi:hypothetical protein
MSYLVEFLHAYSMHFGFWVCFMFGATIYKNGMPDLEKVRSMLKTAVLLASILSFFSSHSQAHYLSHFTGALQAEVKVK